MKFSRIILSLVLLILTVSVSAQLNIEKRKHRKGYQISSVKKHSSPKDFVIRDGERVTISDLKEEAPAVTPAATVETVVLPVISSPSLEFVEEVQLVKPVTPQVKPTTARFTYPSILRKGAGLVLKKPLQRIEKFQTKYTPEQGNSQNTIASIGFILSLFAFIGGVGIIASGGAALFAVLSALAIPGLILSIIGLKSDLRTYAIMGVVFSALVILSYLLVFLFILALFSNWN